MACGPLQAFLIAQVGSPTGGSEASKGRPDPLGQGSVIATLPHLPLQGRGNFKPFGPMVRVAVVIDLVVQLFETAEADGLSHPGDRPQLLFPIGQGEPSRSRHI
jgi:hypothetical protein